MSEQRTVDGRYRLDEAVGSGGMGVVWRAFDKRLGRVVAVKEVRFPSAMTDEERAALTKRALLEARSAGRLDHPNIVPVHDVILEAGQPFIIMRFIEGRSLDQTVSADGPLPDRVVARIGVQLLDALGAAHASDVIHRDVKPHNVLIQTDGTAQLTDFSIASIFGTETLTKTGALLGSPGYIAPERLMTGSTTPAGDLFALGATLFFAAEGIGPFTAKETIVGLFASATRPHPRPKFAGPRLTRVIDGLLEKNPDERLDRPQARALLSSIAEAPEESETRSGEFVPPPPGRVDTDDRVHRASASVPGLPQGDLPSDNSTAVFAPTRAPEQLRPLSWQPGPSVPVSGVPVSGVPVSGARELGWGPGPAAHGNSGHGNSGHGGPPTFRAPGAPASPPAGRRWKRVLVVLTIVVLGMGAGIIASLVATQDRTERANRASVAEDVPDNVGETGAEPTPYVTPGSPVARTTGQEPKPSETPDPSPSTPGPSATSKTPSLPPPGKVTSMTLSVTPPPAQVDCSAPLVVSIAVSAKTTGAATVNWSVFRGGEVVVGDTNKVTDSDTGFAVTRTETIAKPTAGTYSYTLESKTPNVVTDGPRTIEITCAPSDPTASP